MKKSLIVSGILFAFSLTNFFPVQTVEAGKFEEIMGYDIEFDHHPRPPRYRQREHGSYVVGRVVDSNNELISGAQIEFAFIDGRTYFAETDRYGNYEIDLPSDLSCDVFIKCGGYRTQHRELRGFPRYSRNPSELDFQLFHDWITGHVVDMNGYALENVRVSITEGDITRENYSDRHGYFRIYLPEDGQNYFLEVFHAGYQPYRTQMILHDEDNVDLTMMIES